MRDLTERQRAFCEAYIVSLNGTQAAIAAGYSTKGAKVRAHEMLRNPRVLGYLAELKEKRIEAFGISSVKVLNELAHAAFADIGEIVEWGTEPMHDEDGNPQMLPNGEPWEVPYVRPINSRDLDAAVRRQIVEVSMSKEGTFKVKLIDQLRARDMLMKHLGLYAERPGSSVADDAMAALGTIKKLIADTQGAPMRPGLRPSFTLIEGGQNGAAATAAVNG